MPDKKFDVLVVGELNVDLILNGIDKFPEIGKEVLAEKMMLTLGSSSAIFASNLSVLGSRVSFCGCIGKDSFANKILHDLIKKGVDCSHILRSETADTGITVALNVGEDRAMVTYPGAMNELKATDVSDEMLLSARHLHVSSIFLQPGLKPGLPDLFRRARALGLTTSLDPQWDPAEKWDGALNDLLPHVNIFLPNLEEFKKITAQDALESALASVQNTATCVVIKNGNTGAIGWNHSEFIEQPSFLNTEVVDAIGAGDSFNAGFIHQFVNGKSLAECLKWGVLCGAVNTTGSGGTTAFADHETVKQTALSKFNFRI